MSFVQYVEMIVVDVKYSVDNTMFTPRPSSQFVDGTKEVMVMYVVVLMEIKQRAGALLSIKFLV